MKKAPKYITNLKRLKRSNAELRAGDIFALKPDDLDFFFGRVVDPCVMMLSWRTTLIYIYNLHSPNKSAVPLLRRDALLLPPLLVDPLTWSRGYFETVASVPLNPSDVLPAHCFRDSVHKKYVNEHGSEVERQTEPCGVYGMAPFRGLDDEISKALGIPLALEK